MHWQSLCIADNATFRNTLVAMRPNATKADLPSTHNVMTYLSNAFTKFIKDLQVKIQVRFFLLKIQLCF